MGILFKNYALSVLSLCVSLMILVNNPLSSYANSESESESESYLFVLGDSLYDPGNNVIFNPSFRASRCPNGMTHFHKATGRLSDGRLVPDFIASKMNIPFIPPIMDEDADFSHGASFASAGSGVFDNHPNAINLPQQYINFTNVAKKWSGELGEEEAKKRLMKSVYLISMGGNDYFSYGNNNRHAGITELQSVVDRAISDMTNVIKDMYNLGARKFMFQNVGPLGCLPMIQQRFGINEGCARPPLTLAVLHNIALFKMAESIKLSPGYSDFTYSVFDYYTLLGERIRDPLANGFMVGDRACFNQNAEWAPLPYGYNCTDSRGTNQPFDGAVCSNPDLYVFFDTGHNTDGLNKDLSEILWNGGDDYVFPYNMKQLVELDLTISLNIDTKNKPLISQA